MITIKTIHHAVCEYYDIPLVQPFHDSRKRHILKYRQIIHYLARILNDRSLTLEKIGQYYYKTKKKYAYSTVSHSVKTAQKFIDTENPYKNELSDLTTIIISNQDQQEINLPKELIHLTKLIMESKTHNDLRIKLSNYLKLM